MKKLSYIFMMLGLAIIFTACSNSSTNDTSQGTTSTDSTTSFEITGLVFEDLNQNQMQDSDEGGISGVTITFDGNTASTNLSGEFSMTVNNTTTFKVDEASLPDGYMLTTDNDQQTIANGESTEAIGYAPSASDDALSIETILEASHDNIKNYEFDLYLNSNGMEMGNLHYATDGNNFIAEDDNLITYFLGDSGKMGVYTKETNQLMVTPAMEIQDIATPFTLVSDLDPATFDEMYYKGTTTFDDKTVYVYKNELPMYDTELYIWPEYNIIVHMESHVNGYAAIFEFRNLKVNELDDSAFEFPAGAEIIDMTNFGG